MTLRVSPADSTIAGSLAVYVRVTAPLEFLVLDLDSVFTVERASDVTAGGASDLAVERRGGKLWIRLAKARSAGETLGVSVVYHGRPRIAPRPPWIGGFQWARTPSGAPWIATSCVNEGPTYSTTTFDWQVSTPISMYNVALNIAPYRTITRDYVRVTGEHFPVTFWVLPENYEKGLTLVPEMLEHLRFYERLLGPYPFRADKYGVAETPHLGMEHQTIIAYGNRYRKNEAGFDELHQHELAHEWFGNLITAKDWSDYWLHEGFYGKGSAVLHALRYVLGNATFFTVLRRFLYPTRASERVTDGSQVRLVTTDDFIRTAERNAKQPLGWFFDVYVRQPALPQLVVERTDDTISLHWEAPGGRPFPMPIDVEIDGVTQRVTFTGNRADLRVPAKAHVRVDPKSWVFRVMQ